jgi:hypothetical protein
MPKKDRRHNKELDFKIPTQVLTHSVKDSRRRQQAPGLIIGRHTTRKMPKVLRWKSVRKVTEAQ